MNVFFLPEVIEYFKNLGQILFQKEYFGFKESAHNYVDELVNDIKNNLPIFTHKPAPKYFDKYGKNMEYAVFRKSRHTQWYVFFRVYRVDNEKIFQVRYIANNHTVAQYL
jgi:hypothetical protein